MNIVVTAGTGLIASAPVRHFIGRTEHEVLVVDKLTCAGNLASIGPVHVNACYRYSQTDICDRSAMTDIYSGSDPDAVMHLTAQ